ncbi:MAG: hypothetical protein AAFV47_07745 [Pseudomonadota bacterium]
MQWVFYAPLQIVGYYLWKYGRTLGDTDAPASTNSMTIVMLPTRLWPILLLGVLATAADHCDQLTVVIGTTDNDPYSFE